MTEGSWGKTVRMREGLWMQQGLSRRIEFRLIHRMERDRLVTDSHILGRRKAQDRLVYENQAQHNSPLKSKKSTPYEASLTRHLFS